MVRSVRTGNAPFEFTLTESAKFTIYAALYENKPTLSGSAMVSCALCVLVTAMRLAARIYDWTDVAAPLIGMGLAAWLYVRYRRAMTEWRAAMVSAWTVLGPEPEDRHFYDPKGDGWGP